MADAIAIVMSRGFHPLLCCGTYCATILFCVVDGKPLEGV